MSLSSSFEALYNQGGSFAELQSKVSIAVSDINNLTEERDQALEDKNQALEDKKATLSSLVLIKNAIQSQLDNSV